MTPTRFKLPTVTWDIWAGQEPLERVSDAGLVDSNVIFMNYGFGNFEYRFYGWDHYFYNPTADGWVCGGWNRPKWYKPDYDFLNSDKWGLVVTSAAPTQVLILPAAPTDITEYHDGVMIASRITRRLKFPREDRRSYGRFAGKL